MFAEAAKKRQDEGRANSHASRRGELVGENLPQPNEGERGPRATDEAAELFGVSGRSVRDAPYPPKIGPSSRLTYQSGNNVVTV